MRRAAAATDAAGRRQPDTSFSLLPRPQRPQTATPPPPPPPPQQETQNARKRLGNLENPRVLSPHKPSPTAAAAAAAAAVSSADPPRPVGVFRPPPQTQPSSAPRAHRGRPTLVREQQLRQRQGEAPQPQPQPPRVSPRLRRELPYYLDVAHASFIPPQQQQQQQQQQQHPGRQQPRHPSPSPPPLSRAGSGSGGQRSIGERMPRLASSSTTSSSSQHHHRRQHPQQLRRTCPPAASPSPSSAATAVAGTDSGPVVFRVRSAESGAEADVEVATAAPSSCSAWDTASRRDASASASASPAFSSQQRRACASCGGTGVDSTAAASAAAAAADCVSAVRSSTGVETQTQTQEEEVEEEGASPSEQQAHQEEELVSIPRSQVSAAAAQAPRLRGDVCGVQLVVPPAPAGITATAAAAAQQRPEWSRVQLLPAPQSSVACAAAPVGPAKAQPRLTPAAPAAPSSVVLSQQRLRSVVLSGPRGAEATTPQAKQPDSEAAEASAAAAAAAAFHEVEWPVSPATAATGQPQPRLQQPPQQPPQPPPLWRQLREGQQSVQLVGAASAPQSGSDAPPVRGVQLVEQRGRSMVRPADAVVCVVEAGAARALPPPPPRPQHRALSPLVAVRGGNCSPLSAPSDTEGWCRGGGDGEEEHGTGALSPRGLQLSRVYSARFDRDSSRVWMP